MAQSHWIEAADVYGGRWFFVWSCHHTFPVDLRVRQPSAAESTPAKHWLIIRTTNTLTDEAFVLLRQSTGIFNMRRKQAELTAVSTPLGQEPAASLRALLELFTPHPQSGAVFKDYQEAICRTEPWFSFS
jgi:hypothetical protein